MTNAVVRCILRHSRRHLEIASRDDAPPTLYRVEPAPGAVYLTQQPEPEAVAFERVRWHKHGGLAFYRRRT